MGKRESKMGKSCSNCKYFKMGWYKEPCATGKYHLKQYHVCLEWKQSLFSKIFKL